MKKLGLAAVAAPTENRIMPGLVSHLSCTSKLRRGIVWNPMITCELLSQTKSLATA